MKIEELIILAGGFGTRLKSVVSHLPKSLAPVNGKPFLNYAIEHYRSQGIKKFIFALGYMHEAFDDFFSGYLSSSEYFVSVENQPMGTGGAIKLAGRYVENEHVFIANGDTLFCVDLESLSSLHLSNEADCSLALKRMTDFNRFGTVAINGNNRIIDFKEKEYCAAGLINGGLYLLNMKRYNEENLAGKFSFENDYLQKYYRKRKFYGMVADEYFIDIGIPEDFQRAPGEIKNLLSKK